MTFDSPTLLRIFYYIFIIYIVVGNNTAEQILQIAIII